MLHLNPRCLRGWSRWDATRPGGRRAAAFVLLALLASGCDGFPAAFAPSGQRVHVRVVGGQTVEVEGRTLAWTDFLAGVRQQVVEAEQGKTPRPWVVVEVTPGTDSKLVNRMLDDLHAAGVRSVDFGR